MKTIIASAPSKLILLGEWSVLRAGGAAIVAAIAHRAAVASTPAATWQVAREDHEPRTILPAQDLDAAPQSLRFLAAVAGVLSEAGSGPLCLRSVRAVPGVGLGSSAAIVVAAVGAGLSQRGLDDDPAAVFPLAERAHRLAQGGKGSGCDVAAAAFGGLISFKRRPNAAPRVTTLALDALPSMRVAYSGVSASTTALIEQARQREQGDAANFRVILDGLDGLVDAFSLAMAPSQCLALLEEGSRLLGDLNRLCGGLLEPPPVAKLLGIARDTGCAAKISGAGGGDCVLAFSDDPQRLTDLERRWLNAGFSLVDATIDKTGVSREGMS